MLVYDEIRDPQIGKLCAQSEPALPPTNHQNERRGVVVGASWWMCEIAKLGKQRFAKTILAAQVAATVARGDGKPKKAFVRVRRAFENHILQTASGIGARGESGDCRTPLDSLQSAAEGEIIAPETIWCKEFGNFVCVA
ncbi:MAG: hypothetical protein AAGL96_00645 [Pseudomonadota bacterium]